MDIVNLKLSPRSVVGKKVKRLRRAGIVPVHMYGTGTEPLALQADTRTLRRILPQVGTNIPLSVDIDGQSGENICFVREVQRHPVTEELLHVDFMRVDIAQTISVEVPIEIIGEAPAVELRGGTLLQFLQSVLIEGRPMDIPASIKVDISVLDDFDKAVYVRDISVVSFGTGFTILTDPDEPIARVNPPVTEAAPEIVEEAAAPAPAQGEAEEQKEGA